MSKDDKATTNAVATNKVAVASKSVVYVVTKNGNFINAFANENKGLQAMRDLAKVPATIPAIDKKDGSKMLANVRHYRLSPKTVQ